MKLALIGNPNAGKTTLFNALTGASAHVGNWPGVTVEKRFGYYKKAKSEKIEIVDLPGIYSLSPYTPEEIVSRNYLLDENPDGIINIVDATNIERNLYLTTQLLELDIPVIVALNMMDAVIKDGIEMNPNRLAKELGVPVVPISALKKEHLEELMAIVVVTAQKPRKGITALLNEPLKVMMETVANKINAKHNLFKAIKLIEDDQELIIENKEQILPLLSAMKSEYPESIFGDDFSGIVADARYQFIDKHIKEVVKKKKNKQINSKSARIDQVLTNKWLGIPIFAALMFLIFQFTFSERLFFIPISNMEHVILGQGGLASPGVILQNCMLFLIDDIVGQGITNWLGNTGWAASLLSSVWLAIGSILSFIPQILLLFLFITILEDSGYMARVAFIMDKIFKKFGLSGKVLMPLLMCFGCAVPGILATRSLETERERRLTIMLSPFFSCGAKVPIWQTIALILYETSGFNQGLTVFLIYLAGIAVAIITASVVNAFFIKGSASPFVMELPAYRSPTFMNILRKLLEKLKGYVIKAGTIIAISAIVIWFLSSFGFTTNGFGFISIEQSILGYIGKYLSHVFYPLGFAGGEYGYFFVIAALTGLIAKEEVPATLVTLASVANFTSVTALAAASFNSDIIPALWSFMIFNLLTIPCMSAVAASIKELGKKKIGIAIVFWLTVSYISALLFYYGIKYFFLGIAFVLIVLALMIFLFFRNSNKKFRLAGGHREF